MIEITRYILACVVVTSHLWHGEAEGQIAVFAFYTLSGYLMTRVLNDRYHFALGRFAWNRVLRLWPAYAVCLGLTLCALHWLPLTDYNPVIRVPTTPWEWVTTVTILGQVTCAWAQWAPWAKPLVTSWSLSIELVCYALLALGFAKSPERLLGLATCGAIAVGISGDHYRVIQAGFIPFACGGLRYWLRPPAWATVLIATCGVPYAGIALMWTLLAQPMLKATPVQDFFGRASYHLFIAHMPLAAVLVVGLGFHSPGIPLLTCAIALTLVLSTALVPVERAITRLKRPPSLW